MRNSRFLHGWFVTLLLQDTLYVTEIPAALKLLWWLQKETMLEMPDLSQSLWNHLWPCCWWNGLSMFWLINNFTPLIYLWVLEFTKVAGSKTKIANQSAQLVAQLHVRVRSVTCWNVNLLNWSPPTSVCFVRFLLLFFNKGILGSLRTFNDGELHSL